MNQTLKSNELTPVKASWQQKTSIRKFVFIFLVIAPPFTVYLVLWLFPNVLSVWYSLLQWDGVGEKVFVGLENYKMLIKDEYFYSALLHNLILMLFIPGLVVLISLFLADILVNRNYRENSFYKVLYYFPNILSSVVIALLWTFIYDGSFGMLNAVLKLVGIDLGQFYWLGDERTALLSIIPSYIWSSVGFYIIIFMNAISSIPKSYYEYAILEGAKGYTRLFRITLPMISEIIKISVLFLVLGTFRGFENILVLTGGGPAGATDVVGLYMFAMAFNTGSPTSQAVHNFGYASTIGMFLFVILVLSKMIIDKFFKEEQVEF